MSEAKEAAKNTRAMAELLDTRGSKFLTMLGNSDFVPEGKFFFHQTFFSQVDF